MFIGKPWLPDFLLKHEFKIYVFVLFLSRFIIPLLLFQIANYFMIWLHNIATIMQYNGVAEIWTPYPLFMNFYIFFLYSITLNDYIAFSIAFFLFNSLADSVNGIIIWKIMEKSRFKYSQYMRWIYAYSPLPLTWISLQAVFEPYIVMLMLIAIYFVNVKRISLFSLLSALAASLKFFPLLAIFSALMSKDARTKPFYKVFFASFVFLLFFNAIALINPSTFLSSYYWQLGRPAWGSIFSLLSFLFSWSENFNYEFYKDFGGKYLDLITFGILGITPDPLILKNTIPLQLSVLKIISIILIAIAISIFVFFARKKNLPFEKFLFGSLSLFLIFSFGFSPQYLLYLYILLFLAMRPNRLFILFLILFQVLALLEYPFSFIFYTLGLVNLQQEILLFYSIVILRSAYLFFLTYSIFRS